MARIRRFTLAVAVMMLMATGALATRYHHKSYHHKKHHKKYARTDRDSSGSDGDYKKVHKYHHKKQHKYEVDYTPYTPKYEVLTYDEPEPGQYKSYKRVEPRYLTQKYTDSYKPKDDSYKPKDDSYKPKDDSYKPKYEDSYKPKYEDKYDSNDYGSSYPVCTLPPPAFTTQYLTTKLNSYKEFTACVDVSGIKATPHTKAFDIKALQLVVNTQCYDAVKSVSFDDKEYDFELTRYNKEKSVGVKISGGSGVLSTWSALYKSPAKLCITLSAPCANKDCLYDTLTYWAADKDYSCTTTPLFPKYDKPQYPEESPKYDTPKYASPKYEAPKPEYSSEESYEEPAYTPSPKQYEESPKYETPSPAYTPSPKQYEESPKYETPSPKY